ncbi:MAG: PAS domain S-box protein [Planctomycetales bacterium]
MQDLQPDREPSVSKIPTALLDQLVTDALIGINAEGRIWYWNRAAERLLGWTHASILDQPVPFISLMLEECFEEFLGKARQGLVAESPYLICMTAGGERLCLSARAVRLAEDGERLLLSMSRPHDDTPVAPRGPLIDVELEKFLQQQTDDSLWDWEIPTGKFRVNDRYLEIRGISRDEFKEDLHNAISTIHEADLAAVQIAMNRALEGHSQRIDLEYRICRPSGEVRWAHSVASIVTRDGNGRPARIVGIQRDTTERRKTLETLRQNEELLESILDSIDDVVWAIDPQERIVAIHLSPRHRLFSDSRVGVQGQTLAEIGLSADVLHEFREAIWRLKHSPGVQSFDYELQSLQGREWYHVILTRRNDSHGEYAGATVVLHNITKIKKATEDASRRGQVQRGLLDAVQAQVWSLDVESRVDDLNAFVTKQTGLTLEQAKGKKLIELLQISPSRREFHQRCLDEVIQSGQAHLGYLDTLPVGGEIRWFSIDTIPTHDHEGTVAGLLIFLYDITPLKKIEASLRESEKRFRLLADAAPVMIWMCDQQGNCTYINRALAEMSGMNAEDFNPAHFLELIHADDLEAVSSQLQEAFANQTGCRMEHRLRNARGECRWLHNETVPRFSENGSFLGMIGCALDVTDRKEAAENLRRSEARYRSLIENSLDAVMTFFPSGRVDFVNSVCESMFGYSHAELKKMRDPIGVLLTPNCEIQRWRFRNTYVQTGQFPEVTIRLEIRDRHGRAIPTECRFSNLHGTGGKASRLLVNIRDLSERLKLEERMRQAEKIEAVGRLSGGMAHDFNNLLTVINGQSSLLEQRPGDDPALKGALREISRAGERAAELTRQLLAFSRMQPQQLQTLSLNEVVKESAGMIASLMGERVELRLDLADDLRRIQTDRGQMDRILMNLLVNARDALSDGGCVEIQTRNVQYFWSETDQYRELSPGDYVELLVRDNGCGMSDEVRAHLFEPFFTTKPMGKGTGLGLPTVYGIVRQNKGSIDVDSSQGAGATFRILLPASSVSHQADAPHQLGLGKLSGRETVLLVEDNDAVRGLTRQLLQTHGYMVLLARDGLEGLEVSRHFNGSIDLVVSDIVMPRLNGCDLVRQLQIERSGIGVLLMSGYADEELTETRHQLKGYEFLAKPFIPSDFLRKVRTLLDQRASQATSS